MNTVYHLTSAKELDADFIDAIKAVYQSKPITIIIQDEESDDLSDDLKNILDERLREGEENFITVEESIAKLRKLHDL